MKKIIILILTLLLLIIAIFGIIFTCKITSTPNFEGEKEFTVQSGETLKQITQNLKNENLINSEFYFELYLYLKGQRSDIQAGTYKIPALNIIDLAKKLTRGDADNEIDLKIIEGWNLKEIAEKLANQKLIKNKNELLNLALINNYKNNYTFLNNISDSTTLSLEGFIFPDTYRIYKNSTLQEIINKTLNNFSDKLTPALQTEITAQGKNLYDVIKIASIIEMEVPHEEDRKIVSGILWKRLENDMPLQVDSTLKYIIGKKGSNALTYAELETDSPYNTYKYKGLPPTPICNPGTSAIRSAIYPKNSDYWFYLSDDEGNTIFSKTGEEHESNVEKYLK